ncbi:hypothetical protein EVAR_19971_1 [Eumeta japonica]|uniref:Uncharacterized protein n=1 Tax=Eumeta variegata TaxID=151549 RepID=A0A4C1V9G9_EUMVA|nr:hypothetical protein EVAR_19971_1 [Eumeta japonica]
MHVARWTDFDMRSYFRPFHDGISNRHTSDPWSSVNDTAYNAFRRLAQIAAGQHSVTPAPAAASRARPPRHRPVTREPNNIRAILWSTWLHHKNEPAPLVRYYLLIEHRREVAASVVFRPAGEGSGNPFPLSVAPLPALSTHSPPNVVDAERISPCTPRMSRARAQPVSGQEHRDPDSAPPTPTDFGSERGRRRRRGVGRSDAVTDPAGGRRRGLPSPVATAPRPRRHHLLFLEMTQSYQNKRP